MAGRRDGRTFIVVHDGIADHPKVEPLSDKAFRLLIETWAWCSRQRTDGRVPLATWSKRSTGKARAELIASGLATVDGTSVEMHDYLEWQRSADEIAEKVTAKQTAGLIGNHRRWHTDRGVSDPDCQFCVAEASQVRSQAESRSDRETSPDTEAETDKGKKKTPSSSGRKRPATKLPDDWGPSDVHREYAIEHGVNLDREVFKFRHHAEANDRRQASWNGAFSTWLANASDWGSSRASRPTLRDPRSGIIVER